VVGSRAAGPQQAQDLHRLVGAGAALGQRHADRVELGRELAADADGDPAAGSCVEVGELLGRDDRVIEG
jgi:hypothetical protein